MYAYMSQYAIIIIMVKEVTGQKSSAQKKAKTEPKRRKPQAGRQNVAQREHTQKKTKQQPKNINTKNAKPKLDAEESRTRSEAVRKDSEVQIRQKPEDAKSRRFKHPMPGILRILLSISILVIFAIVCTWFVLWRGFDGNEEKLSDFITEKPGLFNYSCLIIFLLTTTIAAFLWRPFLAMGIVFALTSALSYAHLQKSAVRGMPLVPEDLLMADQLGEMESFVDTASVVRLVAGITFVLLGCGLLEHFLRRLIGRNKKTLALWDRVALLPRLAFGGISLTALVLLATPVVWNASLKSDLTWIDDKIAIVAWSQQDNYANNGFVVGFLYNLSSLNIEPPESYSQERIKELYDKYQAIKDADTERKPLSEVVDNLIIVLSESSYDPSILGEHYAIESGDVMPNLHRLFKEYPSGYMYSPQYGGGTANVEFAVFTGLSNAWINTTPYVTSLAKVNYIPGVTSTAKDDDFKATAIHSFEGTMYKRNFVYENMLFDDFIDISKMKYQEHENKSPYVNERSIYQEALDILEASNDKKLLALATMQNHAPYWIAEYPEHHFSLINKAEGDWWGIEASYESLYYADQYLGEFIDKLDELEGRTVMLWYGDHAAGILSDYTESGDPELEHLAHLTPYFIYANFELDNLYTTKEVTEWNKELGFEFPTRGVDLPTVTPNCLSNILYDVLGVEKPVVSYLVDQVCDNLESAILADSYQKDKVLDSDILREYELVSYDLIGGKNYWGKLVQQESRK